MLSPYIWIYAVGTAIFTCLTLGSWYCYGKHRQRHGNKDAKREEPRNHSNNEFEQENSEGEVYVEQVENREARGDKGE